MSLAALIEQAVKAKVVLATGQKVIVRTKKGVDVVRGIIREVHPELGVVRVQDFGGGTDLQVDVGTKNYDLYVQPPDEPLPLAPSELTAYTRVGRASYWRWT